MPLVSSVVLPSLPIQWATGWRAIFSSSAASAMRPSLRHCATCLAASEAGSTQNSDAAAGTIVWGAPGGREDEPPEHPASVSAATAASAAEAIRLHPADILPSHPRLSS